MATKVCTRCVTEKELVNFHKAKSKDGFKPWCKPCCTAYRKENAAVISQKEKAYRAKNADKYKQWSVQYFNPNADKIREYAKMYRDAMSDEQRDDKSVKNKEYCKKYYIENKEAIDAANRVGFLRISIAEPLQSRDRDNAVERAGSVGLK